MATQDLKPTDFPTLQWETDKLATPLNELCAYITGQTQKAIDWYYRKRQLRRYFCRIVRISAILLTAFAGLLPLINEIVGSGHALHSLWSAVALAVAATLIMLDRFYGFTSGWIRFLLTAQQLTQALASFQLEIERQKLGWENPEPTREQSLALMGQIQQFHQQVLGIINDETKAWAAEFTEVLKQIDEQAKLAAQASRKAALQITITNGDQCTGGWNLTVGERAPEKRSGRSSSVEVLPGLHVVRVSGQIENQSVHAEQAVTVGAGEIQKVELTLT
jgi:hypothetical protein